MRSPHLRYSVGPLAAGLAIAGTLTLSAPAARADACDDLAAQLKGQIDGLTVGKPGVNLIELKHPAVTRASLGCSSRNVTNEIFAATDSRKPSEAFYDVMARAAAIVFTIPKTDAMNGTRRCIRRIGIFRGYSIATRYRRLDIRCTGGKTGTTVSISREKDT
jgi:hypothetical protein